MVPAVNRKQPIHLGQSPAWLAFLSNHRDVIAALDFVTSDPDVSNNLRLLRHRNMVGGVFSISTARHI